MLTTTPSKINIQVRRFTIFDIENLYTYLTHLSPETKKRFGPHKFDKQSIFDFYRESDKNMGYITLDNENHSIIGYFIIKKGFLAHDRERLEGYHLTLDNHTDCTFAPSVADHWQGSGVGKLVFQFILSDLKKMKFSRIILWGGVQSDNNRAVNYYINLGFKTLGQFSHNGNNLDMIYSIDQSAVKTDGGFDQ